MRRLKTKDILRMSKIMGRIKLSQAADFDYRKVAGEDKSDTEKVGMVFVFTIFENMHLAEAEISEFFEDVFEIDKGSFMELEFDELLEYFEELSRVNNLESFFKQAGRLMK